MTAVAPAGLPPSHHHHHHAAVHSKLDIMGESDVNVHAAGSRDGPGGAKRRAADEGGESERSKKAKQQQPAAPQLVQLRGNKLALRQKAVDWTKSMSTLQAILALNNYLSGLDAPLERIPEEHLHVVAKLTQESDKTSLELARSIRKTVIPEADADSGSSSSSSSGGADDCAGGPATTAVAAIQAAVETVAERVNYGLASLQDDDDDNDDEAADVPPGLQIWRWEVRDTALLAAENVDKVLARREERQRAREAARQLLAEMSAEQRASLVGSGSKAKKSAAASNSTAASATTVATATAAVTVATTAPNRTEEKENREEHSAIVKPADEESSATVTKLAVKRAPKKAVDADEEARREAKRQEKEAKRAERQQRDAAKEAQRQAAEAKRHKAEQAKKKQASMMFSLFQPRDAASSASPSKQQQQQQQPQQQSDFEKTFPACNYRDMAPVNRFFRAVSGDDGEGSSEHSCATLLDDFKARVGRSSSSSRRARRGIHPPVSVREAMRLVTEASVLGDEKLEEDGRRGLASLADRRRVPIKLLSFQSDRRPAWYGTWTRATNLVGARRPLGQDPVALDYSYDSDAEWEDADAMEGDDVQDNDERDDDDGDSRSDGDSEMDDWLVDDLEEEDDEGEEGDPFANGDPLSNDDLDDDVFEVSAKGNRVAKAARSLLMPSSKSCKPSTSAMAGSSSSSKKKKKRKIKSIGRRFETKLVPFQTGPHWEAVVGQPSYEGFRGYQIDFLSDAGPGLNPFTFESAPPPLSDIGAASSSAAPATAGHVAAPGSSTATGAATATGASPVTMAATGASTATQAKASAFPPAHLADLLRAIEGDTTIRAVLVETLREKFSSVKGASKGAIDACVAVYAEREGKRAGSRWVVRQPFRKQAGL